MSPCPVPYSKPTFHHGRPIPNSPFENWVRQESTRSPGEPHPRSLKLSTNWLDGTESIPNLLLSSHSPVDLSSTIQTFISRRGNQINPSQRIGIESYLLERKTGHFGTIAAPEDRETMMRYYDYFNDIIFCGSLEGLCAIRFCRDSDRLGMGTDDLGAAITPVTGSVHRVQIPDGYAALIKIKDRSEESPRMDEETRLLSYLSTLLHEMLHVFFGVYVCLCSNACRKRHADEIGRNGHRKSWQLPALAVEEASLALLGEVVDLSRRTSFEEDEEYVESVDAETRVRFKFEE
jgi:hypothetical protein